MAALVRVVYKSSPILILPLLISILLPGEVKKPRGLSPAPGTAQVQLLVEGLKARLGISAEVTVEIQPHVEKLVSIRPTDGRKDTFVLLFDNVFLGNLEPDELRAVIAHELGHLLIFTQHPYLQTEPLANRHALKIVSRESLESAYTKVWQRTGRKGSINDFLGP